MPPPAGRYIANFDSAAACLRAVSRFLQGKDFTNLGEESAMGRLTAAADLVPRRLRLTAYALGGAYEGVPGRLLEQFHAEDLSRWLVSHYPAHRYPGVVIGSSNGAAVHLAAALGYPFIPQTFLIPVRHRRHDPDDFQASLRWAEPHAERPLAHNPDLQLHHMHDPNQDRLMVRYMSYFRIKRRRLGDTLRAFLAERLEPGAPIVVTDCRLPWPVTRLSERHFFQPGAWGGIEPAQYLHADEQVGAYLRSHGAREDAWSPPTPNAEAPEAEWGFEPSLRDDLVQAAHEQSRPLITLAFDDPQHLSPLVADLHRRWYRRHNLPDDRLLAESFILLDPVWTIRTARVPYWCVFGVERSAESLDRYLAQRDFTRADAFLFSHGTDSAGLAYPDRWKQILRRTSPDARLLGVNERAYPADFATFARYSQALRRHAKDRHPLPPPLTWNDVEAFMSESACDAVRIAC